MVAATFILSAIAYAASCGLYAHALLRGGQGSAAWARSALIVGIVSHLSYLYLDASAPTAPMQPVHQTLTALSLGISIAFLIAGRVRKSVSILGAFIAPVAFVFFVASGLGRSVAPVPPEARSLLLPIHIGVNILGIIAFALAFAASVAYLLQERLVRSKRLTGLFERLPALDVLDVFSLRAVSTGFPMLTVGVLTGTFWVTRGGPSLLGSAQAFGLLAWVNFAGVLLLRVASGWRGKRAAVGTIIGFLLAAGVLLSYWLRTMEAS